MHQNVPFQDQIIKNFLGRGLPRPLPGGEGDTPSPHPTPSAPRPPKLPPMLYDIERVQSAKLLGIYLTEKLSKAEHVEQTVSCSVQSEIVFVVPTEKAEFIC